MDRFKIKVALSYAKRNTCPKADVPNRFIRVVLLCHFALSLLLPHESSDICPQVNSCPGRKNNICHIRAQGPMCLKPDQRKPQVKDKFAVTITAPAAQGFNMPLVFTACLGLQERALVQYHTSSNCGAAAKSYICFSLHPLTAKANHRAWVQLLYEMLHASHGDGSWVLKD